ncbi:MAG: phospholipid transport system substrate-binding protein [Methyloprofundus sp.]|nr:MAG: phospholipid transport system substrate-binding protein [Methyloprofundus sp.]
MTTPIIPRFILLSCLFFFANLTTAATESLLAPQKIIDNTSQMLLAKLTDPDFASNKKEVRTFVDKNIFPNVDTVRMSALVLGKHWRKASKQQKKQFIAAFKNLLVNTYSSTFTEQFKDWTIQYLPLKLKENAKKALVKTKVQQTGKPTSSIDYSMILHNGQWKIYDIKVEGISLVISNRTSFNQMIKEAGSLDNVIVQLQEKNKG